ncbi:hypothetical protein ACO1O0_001401 [Amphichorda felina]
MAGNFYIQKPYADQFAFQGLTSDASIGQAITTDDAIPIFDLEGQDPSQAPYGYQFNLSDAGDSRRISGSSFTMSTSGNLSDIHAYEDCSTAMSDAPSYCSDYPPPSNRNSWMSAAVERPRHHVRVSDLLLIASTAQETTKDGLRAPMGHFRTEDKPLLRTTEALNPTWCINTLPSDTRPCDAPPPLLSHGLFRMLQGNADAHALHRRYAELSDPPDLFGCLSEEQSSPPEEDMNPTDPEMTPREQDLRFEGDLYTPRWVRGHGHKREGWCGICKPGRWLVLKNSAYWYDKSFSHGISAATGAPFQEPLDTRRMDGNPDVWEGLCGSCNDWIALVSSKKKGTTWFRHAYKCHLHPKVKDGTKRRRESSQTKASAGISASKVNKTEAHQLATPHLTPSSGTSTPIPSGIIHPGAPQLQAPPPPTLMSNDARPNMI